MQTEQLFIHLIPGYVGKDTFEYNVCSTPSPIVCDVATVYVDIAVCPAPSNQNVIAGTGVP